MDIEVERQPRRSTRFPYTTLFRSQHARRALRAGAGLPDAAADAVLWRQVGVLELTVRGEAADGDRKSTRLNYSHVEISYAVFCLKKKNVHLEGVASDNRSS